MGMDTKRLTAEEKTKFLRLISSEENEEYWSEIYNIFEEFLIKLIPYSFTDLGFYSERNWRKLNEEDRTVSDQFYDARFDIQKLVLNYLETTCSGWFPDIEFDL